MLHLLRNISVPVQSVEQLLNNNDVCPCRISKSIKGMDRELIGFAEWVASHNNKCYADTLTSEFIELSIDRMGCEDTNQALMKVGYKMVHARCMNTIRKYAGVNHP
jgi:hypothetical protein